MRMAVQPFTVAVILRDGYLLAAIAVAWLAGLILGRVWGRALALRNIRLFVADAIRHRNAPRERRGPE